MAFDFSTRQQQVLKAYSLAGLTDIVLLLLVFFLLTSTFIPQFGIQVNLPDSDASAPATDIYVHVAITQDGRFFVGGEEVRRAELLSAIRAARGDHAALVLRADREATIDQFAAVATAARTLDLRVLMATEQAGVRAR